MSSTSLASWGWQVDVSIANSIVDTQNGTVLLKNFAVGICGATQNWTMGNFVEQEIARIRKLVGPTGRVLGAVSGGVDSTVAAKLMHEAIGDRFTAVLVDHGYLRYQEREQVEKDLNVWWPFPNGDLFFRLVS